MIIKIISPIDLSTDADLKIMAIENILKAHGEGKHHVWMPIEIVKSLLKNKHLGLFSRRVLDALMSQVNEESNLHKIFSFHTVVDFIDKYKANFSDGKLILGYNHFSDSSSTQEPVLLTENELDGEAFLWGAKTFLRKNRLSALQISIDIQPGGGNTTFDNFERLERGKRFFVCIVDSDKDHPKAALGDTAARFNKTQAGHINKRYFEILGCHEIENIIPISILREIYSEHCEKGIVHKEEFINYRAYPDHKLGLAIKDALADDIKYKATYWHQFSKKEEDETLCAGFGPNMLKTCLEFMKKLSPQTATHYIDEQIDKEWLRISKIIASWGAGGRGLRS